MVPTILTHELFMREYVQKQQRESEQRHLLTRLHQPAHSHDAAPDRTPGHLLRGTQDKHAAA